MDREHFNEVYRHSLAHILAKAVMEIFGRENVQIAIGPQIADGMYYAFLLPRGICMRERDSAYAETKENCLRLLEQLEISGLLDVRAKELSGGERRRVCIARALAARPAVVFADEPTSDLDDESTRTALSVLRQAADDGCAVMIVSHDAEATDYADEKRKMDAGHL